MATKATRDTSVSVPVNDHEKSQLEVLADHYWDCSQAEAMRTLVEETFAQVFGDLDPEALLDGRIPADVVDALIAGEVTVDEVTDDRGEDVVWSLPAGNEKRVATADGGAVPHPQSYRASLSPVELARPGATLSWSDLRSAVSDDGHWDDDLEIHPDRVPARELKSNHKYTPRIIAAICRARAQNGLVPADVFDEVLDDYLMHLHDRHDEDAGRRYVRETYRPLVEEHLTSNPVPTANSYITDESFYHDVVEESVSTPAYAEVMLADGTTAESDEEALDLEAWSCGQRVELPEYLDRVSEYVAHLATLWNFHLEHSNTLGEIGLDYPDEEYADPHQWIIQRVRGRMELVDEHLSREHKQKLLTYHLDGAVRDLVVGADLL